MNALHAPVVIPANAAPDGAGRIDSGRGLFPFLRWIPRIAIILLLSAAATGCHRKLEVPKPELTPSPPPPPAEPSTINIPVTIDLAPLFKEAETMVPKDFRASNAWTTVATNPLGDIGIKYEIWRDPLRLSVSGNRLDIAGKVYYWFVFGQNIPRPFVGGSTWKELASCGRGEPAREASLGMNTTVVWDDDWYLSSTTKVAPVSFANRCKVTFLQIDVTDRVSTAFADGLTKGAQTLDSRIRNSSNFRPMAEQAWRQLQEPLPLDSGLWLLLDPQLAYASPPSGNGSSVTATVGINATPRVVLSRTKPAPAIRALPKLQVRSPGEGFHMTIDSELPFAEANRLIAQALVSTRHDLAGHTVTITGANVYGAGGLAVMKLDLVGDITGSVYLVGKPAYDAATQMLYVKDLDFSLETRHAIANVADWLNHEGFRRTIARQARWPLAGQISDAQKRIETALNRQLAPNAKLVGRVTGIRPAAVYTTSTSFYARVVLDGQATVQVK
jgi:hypothetical protein